MIMKQYPFEPGQFERIILEMGDKFKPKVIPRSPEQREAESQMERWGNVTDPNEHNPNQFRYLVHAFNPYAKMNKLIVAMYDLKDGIAEEGVEIGDQKINLFDRPERLHERVSLSMSFVDQEHTGTWGAGGLIIEAAPENVIMSAPEDLGSHNANKKILLNQAKGLASVDADTLLAETRHGYNEVVALAKSDSGKQVVLKGFFLKIGHKGVPLDPVIAERMRDHSSRLGLPLVYIKEKSLQMKDSVSRDEAGVPSFLYLNGRTYKVGDTFHVVDEDMEISFPELHELKKVLQHFEKNGELIRDEVEAIERRYVEKEKEHRKPKITYSESHPEQISSLTMIESAFRYYLSDSGYCTFVDIQKEREQSRKDSLRDSSMQSLRSVSIYVPTSSDAILSVLENKKDTMSKEEFKRVSDFVTAQKVKIDEQFKQYQQRKKDRMGFDF